MVVIGALMNYEARGGYFVAQNLARMVNAGLPDPQVINEVKASTEAGGAGFRPVLRSFMPRQFPVRSAPHL
jgi:hypothetical protein